MHWFYRFMKLRLIGEQIKGFLKTGKALKAQKLAVLTLIPLFSAWNDIYYPLKNIDKGVFLYHLRVCIVCFIVVGNHPLICWKARIKKSTIFVEGKCDKRSETLSGTFSFECKNTEEIEDILLFCRLKNIWSIFLVSYLAIYSLFMC